MLQTNNDKRTVTRVVFGFFLEVGLQYLSYDKREHKINRKGQQYGKP